MNLLNRGLRLTRRVRSHVCETGVSVSVAPANRALMFGSAAVILVALLLTNDAAALSESAQRAPIVPILALVIAPALAALVDETTEIKRDGGTLYASQYIRVAGIRVQRPTVLRGEVDSIQVKSIQFRSKPNPRPALRVMSVVQLHSKDAELRVLRTERASLAEQLASELCAELGIRKEKVL